MLEGMEQTLFTLMELKIIHFLINKFFLLLIKQELKVLNSRENLPTIYNSEGTTPTMLNITDNLNYN